MSRHRFQLSKPPASAAAAQPSAPPPGAWWNNIRRAWFVDSDTGPVLVDPQPPPFVVSHPLDALAQTIDGVLGLPPAVKVTA